MNCPYCNKKAIWCENKEIYGRNYGKSYMCYYCKDCDAYVGCHNNTKKPLGRMANKELRELRKESKNLWINKIVGGNYRNRKLRSRGYKYLRNLLNKEFHFGDSTIEECTLIINKLKK